MKVFPLPVAIWIRARGLDLAKDPSRFEIASTWQSRKPSLIRGGRCFSRLRRESFSIAHSSKVSGVWKEKTFLDLASGSFRLRKRVSTPVLSYAKGRGF